MTESEQAPNWMQKANSDLDDRSEEIVTTFYNNLQAHTDEHHIPPETASQIMAQYIRYGGLSAGKARAATLNNYRIGTREFRWQHAEDIVDTTAESLRTQVSELPSTRKQAIQSFQRIENRPVRHVYGIGNVEFEGEYNERIDSFKQKVRIDVYQYGDVGTYPDEISPLEEGMLPEYALVVTKLQLTGLYHCIGDNQQRVIAKKSSREEVSRSPRTEHVRQREGLPELEPAGVDIHRFEDTEGVIEKAYRLLHDSGYRWESIKKDIAMALEP